MQSIDQIARHTHREGHRLDHVARQHSISMRDRVVELLDCVEELMARWKTAEDMMVSEGILDDEEREYPDA